MKCLFVDIDSAEDVLPSSAIFPVIAVQGKLTFQVFRLLADSMVSV